MLRLDSIARLERPAAVALGMFDGVHLGHQAVIGHAVAAGRRLGVAAAVFSFREHPSRVLFPDRAKPLLTTAEEKADALARLGVEAALLVEFSPELAATPPAEFVEDILIARLQARVVCVGENFTFGRGGAGTTATLAEYARAGRFELDVAPTVAAAGGRVSSSRVRTLLAAGDVAGAAGLLGRPYTLGGRVVAGQGLGARVLGIPTANLQVDPKKLLPADGVYDVRAIVGGREHRGALNVGVRPTVGGSARTVEVHLLGYQGDLLGQELRLHLERRLRAEQKFPDLDALKRQIHADIARVASNQ